MLSFSVLLFRFGLEDNEINKNKFCGNTGNKRRREKIKSRKSKQIENKHLKL